MKRLKTRLIYLLLIFSLLSLAYSLPKLKQKFFPKRATKIFPFKKEEIKEITFQFSKEKTQTLKKQPDGWKVAVNKDEFPADKNRVENLLEFLTSLEKSEIVSRKKEKHKNFGIGDKKIVVKDTSGKTFTLFIGNPAGLQKYYARVDEQNEVFITEGLELFPQDLRDLQLNFIASTEKVEKITLKSEKGELVFEKTKDGWKINDKKADKSKVDFLLSDLAALKGEDIKKAGKKDKIVLTIQAVENKKTKILNIYKVRQEYWANIEKDKYFYKLSSFTVDNLKKVEKDFLP